MGIVSEVLENNPELKENNPFYYQGENNQEVNNNYSQLPGFMRPLDAEPPQWAEGNWSAEEIEEVNKAIKKRSELNTPSHYDNSKGSLYKFAEDHQLNAWEFDILKRVVRCRKKGQFLEDLDKTIEVLKLYKKEYNEKT